MTEKRMKEITWHLMSAARIQLILKRDVGLKSDVKKKLEIELEDHISRSLI